jgi:hypothetical protein
MMPVRAEAVANAATGLDEGDPSASQAHDDETDLLATADAKKSQETLAMQGSLFECSVSPWCR